MNQPDPQWHWIQNKTIAQALLDPPTLRCFTVFMSGALDLHTAAGHLGLKRTTLRYHVNRFIEWGLLAPTQRVSKRQRQSYQVVYSQLYIPFQVSGQASIEELLFAMQDPLQRAFVHSLVREGSKGRHDASGLGVVIRPGSVDFTLTDPPQISLQEDTQINTWSSWTTIHLTASEASALKTEITALWTRYLALEQGRSGAKPYMLRLGLAPEATE